MRKLRSGAVLVCLLAVLLGGCGTISKVTRKLGASAFTGASLTDITMEGVRTQECVSLVAAPADPAQRSQLGNLLAGESVGCLLGVSRVGMLTPEWLFCAAGDQEKLCKSIPANAHVVFSGQPLGVGGVWVPSRVTWNDR